MGDVTARQPRGANLERRDGAVQGRFGDGPRALQAFAQPHIAHRGLLVEADGARQIAPPLRFADEPDWSPQPAPELGADG